MDKNIENETDKNLLKIAEFVAIIDKIESAQNINEIKKMIYSIKNKYSNYIKNTIGQNDFLSLNLSDEIIKEKVRKNEEIYIHTTSYKRDKKILKQKKQYLMNELSEEGKEILQELKQTMQKLNNYDIYLAYKIGLIDGIKIKNKCT